MKTNVIPTHAYTEVFAYQAADHHINVIVLVDLWAHHVKSLLVVFQASMNQVLSSWYFYLIITAGLRTMRIKLIEGDF